MKKLIPSVVTLFLFFIIQMQVYFAVGIPYQWAKNMPKYLNCKVYYFVDEEWVCHRLDASLISNPKPFLYLLGLVLIIFVLAFDFNKIKIGFKQILFFLHINLLVVSGIASYMSIQYYRSGYANIQYGYLALAFSIVFITLCTLLFLECHYSSKNERKNEKLRKKKLGESLEIEIAERLAEKNQTKSSHSKD
jgi:hypothetical protein